MQLRPDVLVLGRAEHIFKLPLAPEGVDGVGGGVGPGQGVQPQTAPVNDRLPEGPQQDGAGEPLQNLAGIGRVGKGDVLQDDHVRLNRVQERGQVVQGQEHLVRTDHVLAQGLQKRNGRFKFLLGAFQMEGTHPNGDVCSLKAHFQQTFLVGFMIWGY